MTDGDPKILPPNAAKFERQFDASLEARLAVLPVQIRHLWNNGRCPPAWLPVLAWALGVENWRSDWPVETKRTVIAATPTVKRLKGTPGAVRRAVQAVAGKASVSIVEWFKPGGSGVPLTARVEIDVTAGATDRLVRDATLAANNAKRESVHLDLRLKARPAIQLQAASLLRQPVVRAVHGGTAHYRPRLPAGLNTAAHIRKPLTMGRISMDGAIVRPLAGAHQIAANLRTTATVARLFTSGPISRPLTGAHQIAANIRTPATVARVIASGV